MSEKPSYLGLLNAIAVAETHAHEYLRVWADVTPSDDVRKVIQTVAAREGEHGMSFAKRMNELGYEVRCDDDSGLRKALEVVRSECSDREKMEALKLEKLDTGDEPDIFDNLFRNHAIDIRTGELLGRYIAEERDSARLLRSCYDQLVAAERTTAGAPPVPEALATLDGKVDALCRAVEELRQIVCAQAMPTSA